MECSANFWTIVEAIATTTSVVVMIIMTCYFHRINYGLSKKENYFRYIIDLYYKIEDNIRRISSDDSCKLIEIAQNSYYREIRVNCSLMLFYVNRYPGFYENRTRFEFLLNDIIAQPEDEHNYDSLAIAFSDFCQNIRKSSKGQKYHFFINGRENGYPEKDF